MLLDGLSCLLTSSVNKWLLATLFETNVVMFIHASYASSFEFFYYWWFVFLCPIRMQKMKMNTYLYAPKDDYKHRIYWRHLYSPEEAGWFSAPQKFMIGVGSFRMISTRGSNSRVSDFYENSSKHQILVLNSKQFWVDGPLNIGCHARFWHSRFTSEFCWCFLRIITHLWIEI